ncbi:hypothetical protein RhiirA5_508262 [Rhizophagus irregularis]|uniref:Uncharacterized protein n=1 Tax=Rhizophagus irregularis TaxID=588596 RepID=A0A2N0ND44_9GLOM|nr:hypothetical protein RhiirA5_508262 [Rhizophagus irregularis]GET65971.1 hypothetical protein RIR_jg20344.t1 [Rhizophagus irregularis DAOM 181602=DAOM 197198]
MNQRSHAFVYDECSTMKSITLVIDYNTFQWYTINFDYYAIQRWMVIIFFFKVKKKKKRFGKKRDFICAIII